MADTKLQVFTYDNLALYDNLLKGYVDAEDAKSLKTVAIDGNTLKFYRVSEPVGETAPAYTITLPETDISGLIPKITGATAGNVVTAKADGTVEDSGIKAADLATKAEVKAVEDKADANKASIDAINNADTGILKTAKDYADSKVKDLADGAVATNTAAIATLNGDETTAGSVKKAVKDASDTINAKIGTVAEGKTVVQMIEDAKTASTYDDTEIRGLIQDNADAIEAHKTAIDSKVTTLVGTDTDKSVRTIANEELAAQLIPESAKESLNTLEEIASWIQNHPDDASAMNAAITALQTLVGTIPEGATATDIVNYIKELVDAEKTRATGAESGLDTRLSAVETLVGEGGSVDDKIATAKQEAIDAAATDATTKANTAETNAKTYADGLNTAMDTRVASIESKVGEGFEPISESFIRGLFA